MKKMRAILAGLLLACVMPFAAQAVQQTSAVEVLEPAQTELPAQVQIVQRQQLPQNLSVLPMAQMGKTYAVTKAEALKANCKRAYLTFDDTVSDVTVQMLDTMKQYGVHATFFVTGKADPDILRRMQAEGHAVGNHSTSHDYKRIYTSSAGFWADFKEQQEYLNSVLGYYPTLMRFPGGSNNTVSHKYGGKNIMYQLAREVTNAGYTYFDWNVSPEDATTKPLSADTIAQRVLSQAKGKKDIIVLMHHSAPRSTSAQALPAIIEGLQAQGFVFLPLTEDAFNRQFLTP